MTSPATARIGVEASPTGRHACGGVAALEHVQISMSALWTPALRLSLELEVHTRRPRTARAPARIQTGLNMFFRRREAHLRGTPQTHNCGPEVQFHRNTTLPGQEEFVRRAPMKVRSLIGK